jgi:hypothetical protein
MGKVNIKIRRKPITADSLEKYRNYPALLKKYKRDKQFKRALRIFLYSLALTAFILLLVFISMWKVLLDKKHETTQIGDTLTYVGISQEKIDTVRVRVASLSANDSANYLTYELLNGPEEKMEFPKEIKFNGISKYYYEHRTKIEVDNKSYEVVRYKFKNHINDTNISYYYYSPDFGLLISTSLQSNLYIQLIKNQLNKTDKITSELIHKIKTDTNFYKDPKP